MTYRVPITVHLDSFEGPLDLLLYLIQSHELDINKVSISKITDQYLAYVRLMQELNFDTASEFLVMAATLLLWKSKSLLPDESKGEAAGLDSHDEFSQEELIRQLLEHQRFLAAGEQLAQLPRLGDDVFTRENRKPPIHKVWREMDISTIVLGYQDMLVRARKRTQVLRKETVSLSDKISEFGHKLQPGRLQELGSLIPEGGLRPDWVVTFLASLELSRLKKMRLHQEATYSTIYLELLESLAGFDMHLATGFDMPNPVASVEAAISAPVPAALEGNA